MPMIVDYFFAPYVPPQEQRRRAALHAGVYHGGQTTPRDPLPGQPVTLHFLAPADLPIRQLAVYVTIDGSIPEGEAGIAHTGAVIMASQTPSAVADLQQWDATLPGQPEGVLVRYRADAWGSADEQHWWVDAVDPIAAPPHAGRLGAYSVDTFHAPSWLTDSIWYHIFVDRFAGPGGVPISRNGRELTEFLGGALVGITAQLDYIASLGVNVIWLSPLFHSPTYHGYNPSSYDEVDPHYGTNADLRELIAQAHARGMRIVLDFVANHTSDQHPAFRAAQTDPTSAYHDWYTFDPTLVNGYLAYAGVRDMPTLTTENDAVQDYLIAAARRWLDDFGADGLRLDNVSGPPHGFWSIFQRGVKHDHPQALTLGEISGAMDDVVSYAGRMDAFMDFPLTKQLRRAFAQHDLALADLLTYYAEHQAEIPAGFAPGLVLDNHDMHRFLWLAENNPRRLRLAALFQLTMPGFPVIYYGAEVGLSQHAGPQAQDKYAREPMLWGDAQDQDLLAYFRDLIALRRNHAALRSGAWRVAPITLTDAFTARSSDCGAYVRSDATEAFLIILNAAPSSVAVEVDVGHIWSAKNGQTPDKLLATSPHCEINRNGAVVQCRMPGLSGVVVRLGEA